MEKLNWFKFSPADWMMGRIQKCSAHAKVEFLEICCLYWNKLGILTEEDLDGQYDHLEELVQRKVLKIENKVYIDFLDEQLCKMMEISQRRKEAGAKGGKANAKQKEAIAKQIQADKKREDRIEKIDKKEKIEVLLPYQEESFANAWMDWKEYKKKEHRFSYKSEESELATLKKLSSECTAKGGGAEMAIEAIYYSIAGGWKGIYFEEKKKQPHTHDIDSVMAWAKNNS